MSDQAEFEKDLGELLAKGQVLVIVGSGVSIAATGNAPAASWTGLLKMGVGRCASLDPTLGKAWEDRLLAQIQSGKLDELLAVADEISRRLGAPRGGEFCSFLRATVGGLQATKLDVLHALRDLRAPIATTNYDSLLEMATGLPVVTWRDQNKVFRVLRGEEQATLHLHGHWEDPESVVLGTGSYEGVVKDNHAQATLRALAMRHSLLFVGCGDGLFDPNFGPFRDWLVAINAENEDRHYRLALEKDVASVHQQHHPDERVCVLSYGTKHEELAGYLRKLLERKAGNSIEDQLERSLRTAVSAFRETLLSIKDPAILGKVLRSFHIKRTEPVGQLDQRISEILDSKGAEPLFVDAIGDLAGLKDVLGVRAGTAASAHDVASISILQSLLTRRIFPLAVISEAAKKLKGSAGVICQLAATPIAPEFFTSALAGLKPDYVEYPGMLRYFDPPLGDCRPEAFLLEVIRDFVGQNSSDPWPSSGTNFSREEFLAGVSRFNGDLRARAHRIFRRRQPLEDNSRLESPVCYCVFPLPADAARRRILHELIEQVAGHLPELAFFELDWGTKTADNERVALQHIGGPPDRKRT